MRRTIITIDIALALLAVACVALAVLLALVSPTLLLIAAAILVVAAVVLVLNVRRLRRAIARLLNGVSHSESATQASLANLSMPVLILSGKSIVWYNDAFLNEVMDGQETCLQSIYRVMPGFDPDKAVMIGDSVHDFEVARALGVHCVLQAAGHQPAAVLRATGAPVADDVRQAAAIILKEDVL